MTDLPRQKSTHPPPLRAQRLRTYLSSPSWNGLWGIPAGFPGSRPVGLSALPVSCFHELLVERARRQPRQRAFTFLVDGDDEELSITYHELDRRARSIAALLQSFVSPGERALLIYPPGLDYLYALFGCLYAGVVAVPACPPDPVRLERTLPRLQALLEDSQASVVLTTAPILALAEVLITRAPDLGALQWMATDTAVSGLEYGWQDPALSEFSPALLQYTCGSTSPPCGVMLTHSNLLYNAWLIAQALQVDTASSAVIWMPPYQEMGLIGGILLPVFLGIHCTLLSPLSFMQRPVRWLQAISRFRAAVSGGPNFAYELCLRKVTREQMDDLDLSSWKVAFNGAEPLRAETLERFSETFARCGFRSEAFYPCYGLPEATLFVSGGDPNTKPVLLSLDPAALEQGTASPALESPLGRRMVSSGRILPGQKILIVDPQSGQRCPDGRVGEIWVAGPGVAAGYWNREEESRAVFSAYLKDTREGPFLRTGDLGFIQDGELFVAGRIKDLIHIDGRSIDPAAIEAAVEACHPGLLPGGCAAFSIEIDELEKLVVAAEFECGAGDSTIQDLDALLQEIVKAVAAQHHLQVHAVLLVRPQSLPRTLNARIQRQACRESYLNHSLEDCRLSS